MDALRSIWTGSTPQQLQTILASFTGEFSNQLNVRFQALYQRTCARKYIAVQHANWAEELGALDTRMADVWKSAQGLYDQIPTLASHQEKMSALSSMLQIERLAFRLTEKCRKLQAILKSTHHQQALVYYKNSVKECEGPIDDKSLTTLFYAEQVQEEKDPEVQEEIDLLYDEVRKFVVYTAGCLGKDLKPETVQMPRKIEAKTPSYVVSDLPAENHFRGHIWFQKSRYPAIYTECLFLHECAKGLYHLEQRLAKRLELVCTTDMESDQFLQEHTEDIQALYELEEAIEAAHFQLTQKPISKKICAGWYYVAGLVAQAKYINQALAEVASGDLLTYAKALSVLRNQPDVHTVALVIQRLPPASGAYTRVHAVITAIFAKEFQVGVALVGVETSFAKEVFERSLHWHAHEKEIESYIVKGLLNPTREFEAVLFRMKRDPLYAADFQRVFSQSQQLQNYVKSQSLEQKKLLRQITDVLVSLHEPLLYPADSRETLFDRFVRLHKAFRLFRSCQDPWFRSQLEYFSNEWKEAGEIAEQMKGDQLYTYLYVSLFGRDPIKQKAADAQIVKVLTPDHCSQPGIIKVLVYRWVLERYMEKKLEDDFALLSLDDRGQAEKDILRELLIGYVTKSKWTKFWRSQYDTGYMELALQKFINETKIKFKARLEGWPHLDKVLTLYANFRKIIDQLGSLRPNTKAHTAAKSFYTGAHSLVASLNSDQENLKIAHELCTEMREFLYHSRISYTRT